MNSSKTVVGVDIAKRVFQLHWVERQTGEMVSIQLKREKLLEHFAQRSPCLIGMEACGGAQHWARELQQWVKRKRLNPVGSLRRGSDLSPGKWVAAGEYAFLASASEVTPTCAPCLSTVPAR